MLIDFALQDDEPKGPLNGGSGETGDRRRLLERKKQERKQMLKIWIQSILILDRLLYTFNRLINKLSEVLMI